MSRHCGQSSATSKYVDEVTDRPRSAREGVSCTGLNEAPNWLDWARDFTASWTHHQEVREAVGLPTLADPRYLDAILDTFVRAFPRDRSG
jgi:hypothetical protein